MKKKNISRILCALLMLIFIFSAVSCERGESKTDYDEKQRLEIVKEDIQYSDAFLENANERFTKSAVSLTESYLGLKLTDKQKENISENFKKTLIPIFKRIRIYGEEVDTLLTLTEEYISSQKTDTDALSIFFSLYEECLYTVGSERSGRLAYELSLVAVENKAETARERYAQYGYSWHLEDAERCDKLLSDLKALGEEKFIASLTMSTFVTSTAQSVNGAVTENAFLLSDAELLFILDRQGELFSKECPTEEEWQILGALITELIPENSSDLGSATLYALKNDGYFTSAAKAMPSLFSLYASVAASLWEEALFSLEGTEEERLRAIILALRDSEEELRSLGEALTLYAKTDSERLKKAIEAYADPEELGAFTDKYTPIECEELIAVIKSAADTAEGADIALKEAAVSYIAGLSPYIAFTLFN